MGQNVYKNNTEFVLVWYLLLVTGPTCGVNISSETSLERLIFPLQGMPIVDSIAYNLSYKIIKFEKCYITFY